uniref:Uncharacterized protein n=1 Tax=Lactuca sativa TaxID=4236 RepID=A0A9R1V4V7_LACSA|nr:hypothetical protein LSAT_V11C700382210 [Lactuca sativa]
MDKFMLATLNVSGHEEFLVTGAFAQGLLLGPLSKKMQGTIEAKERKEANLKFIAHAYIKQEEPNSHHAQSPNHRDHHEPRRHRDKVHAIEKKPPRVDKVKGKYFKYHKSKTHDTGKCMVLRKEMDEKHIECDLKKITKDLRSKFDADQSNA